MQTSVSKIDEEVLIAAIEERKWWQGSVIPQSDLISFDMGGDASHWIVASQTCNLYNENFDLVPRFEVVAANKIDECKPEKVKGDNPRQLHVVATAQDGCICLDVDIQNRKWLPRSLLAELPAPAFHIVDGSQDQQPAWLDKQWLDLFSGWLGRSYTRVALPDEFNEALAKSKIEDVLKKKLIKFKDELYGVYLKLDHDTEEPWAGVLGQMPPPYNLGIVLVTHEHADPEELKKILVRQIHEDKVNDPADLTKKTTRADLANRYQVRTIKQDIEAQSVAEIRLLDLKKLVRFSLIDHLSNSSMAAPNQ